MGAMFCVVATDDVDGAAVVNVEGPTYSEVSKTTTFTLSGDASYYFKASLLNSSGVAQSGAVSPSSGNLGSDFKYNLTVTAPSARGDYTLSVDFYENSTSTTVLETKKAPLKVVEPVKLSITLTNSGDSAVTFNAYFVINGEKIDDSEQSVTVSANSTATAKYDYVVENLNRETKYALQTDDENAKEVITGLGDTKAFYTSQDDHLALTVLIVVVLIILIIALVFIYRKPVKNTGKPKARR